MTDTLRSLLEEIADPAKAEAFQSAIECHGHGGTGELDGEDWMRRVRTALATPTPAEEVGQVTSAGIRTTICKTTTREAIQCKTDVCQAASVDGVCCPDDSCDLSNGTRTWEQMARGLKRRFDDQREKLDEKQTQIDQLTRDSWDTIVAIGTALGLPAPPDPTIPHSGDLPERWRGKMSEKVAALKRSQEHFAAEIEKARAFMDFGADDERWKPGTTAIDALIAECSDYERGVDAVMKKLKPNLSNDMPWEDEVIICYENVVQELTEAQKFAEAAVALKALHLEGGKFEMTLELAKEVMLPLAEAAALLVKDAQNYVEMELTNRAGERYTFTLRKPNGETPHQLREKAEKDVARLDALLMECVVATGYMPPGEKLTAAGRTAVPQAVRDKIDELDRMRDTAVARAEQAEALSVTKVMLDIVPGDGSGHEVYAKTVREVEEAMAADWARLEEAEAKGVKLQAFKDFVHRRLDEIGITKEPNGPHSAEGCRVGDRIDEVAYLRQAALNVLAVIDNGEKDRVQPYNVYATIRTHLRHALKVPA